LSIWRPILAQITTLHEIDEYWDINDLADANEALDIKNNIESSIIKESKEDDIKDIISKARI